MQVYGIDIPVFDVATKVLFLLLGFWLGYSAKRPKLQLAGSGSGGIRIPNKDVMATSVQVRNNPSFFGLPVNRDKATITEARLLDPDLREYVGPCLMWATPGSEALSREIAIESGRDARLYVVAKERYDDNYFVFSANKLTDELPRQLTKYKDKKKAFVLSLRDVNGQEYRYDIVLRNTEQSVHSQIPVSPLWRRLSYLWRAIGPLQ